MARFGALSLLLTVGVGILLAHVLITAIENRAQEQAEWTVIGTVRLGLQPQLTPADLANGFDPGRLAEVEKAIAQAADNLRDGSNLGDLDPVALKIFNRDRTIVWADDPALIGRESTSHELGEALDGEVGRRELRLEAEPDGADDRPLRLLLRTPLDGRGQHVGEDQPDAEREHHPQHAEAQQQAAVAQSADGSHAVRIGTGRRRLEPRGAASPPSGDRRAGPGISPPPPCAPRRRVRPPARGCARSPSGSRPGRPRRR